MSSSLKAGVLPIRLTSLCKRVEVVAGSCRAFPGATDYIGPKPKMHSILNSRETGFTEFVLTCEIQGKRETRVRNVAVLCFPDTATFSASVQSGGPSVIIP